MSQGEIIEYQALGNQSAKLLVKAVNEAIKMGWQPLGGIAHSVDGDGDRYYTQALVKYRPVSKDDA